jgi:hydroxyacid-oxoacid transhydrogenase
MRQLAHTALELSLYASPCACHSHSASTILHPHNHRHFHATPKQQQLGDYAFEFTASTIRWGRGVTIEAAAELSKRQAKRVLVITDPIVSKLETFHNLRVALETLKVPYEVFDNVRVEPTDKSFMEAINFARKYKPDAFLSFGGGSVIDTAKAANLYSKYPDADLMDFVNYPVGKGKLVPGPIFPHYAIPTTAGTGSETTGQSIFDLVDLKAKTGIGSKFLKPTLGLIDPENTKSMPTEVAISSAWDVLCHCLESYTAVPYEHRRLPRPTPISPFTRPAYQGSNPVSDIWSIASLRIIAKHFLPAVLHNSRESHEQVTLAATYAGIGFGNAGVHLCHALSYPISGLNKHLDHVKYIHPGYKVNHPLVPHGVSVAIPAPAVFRFTAHANPARHLECARILNSGLDESQRIKGLEDSKHENDGDYAGQVLSETILKYMELTKVPLGITKIGYKSADIPDLVKGALPQKRITSLAPLYLDDQFARIFETSLEY